VTYDNGKFYLYYSSGNEILMELRIAISDRPDGGFVDAGIRLTNEEFAIDAHVFVDDDGTRYFFYATDFLEYSHIGTGTVVDRMLDWTRLEGNPRPVTRAEYDWQVYDPARKEKGGVRWYTVEGPTVLKRKGKYFEMFSGGNWQNKTYGVSFAVTDSMNSTDEWQQFSDGERTLPILRTIPGKVVGPGHNSVVRGPNNRELYCIYHRWTETGRVLAIDRMDFAGDRIFVAGPTTDSQPMPFLPLCADNLMVRNDGWKINGNTFTSAAVRKCGLTIRPPEGGFLLECTVRFVEAKAGALFGIVLGSTRFELLVDDRLATLHSAKPKPREIKVAAGLDLTTFHLLRIEALDGVYRVMFDDVGHAAETVVDERVGELFLISENGQVELSAIEITPGFEECFESSLPDPSRFSTDGNTHFANGQLSITPLSDDCRIGFPVPYSEFMLAANVALKNESLAGTYGLLLLNDDGSTSARLSAQPGTMSVIFETKNDRAEIGLPESFVGSEYRQFRLVSQGGRLTAYLDGIILGKFSFDIDPGHAAVFGDKAISIEMMRLTGI
jgi:hypothetical protein